MDKLKTLLFCCACVLAQASAQATPSSTAESESATVSVTTGSELLAKIRHSFNSLNFEASFILVKGKFAESYNWMHGIYQGVEFEYMRSQNGVNLEIVRKGGVVGYFEADSQPHTVKSHAIEGVLPAVFFDSSIDLSDYYSISAGGKSRVLDRAAQLVRIDAKDNFRHNYWLWLDIQTGLILKSALISKQGEVLEQFQITHLNVLDSAPKLAEKISETTLPEPVASTPNSRLGWLINWLPQGFKLVSSNQHKLPLTGEATDYFMVTDGLVELSIYIQKPLNNNLKPGSIKSGSNVVAVHHGNGFDVSVIGKVPAVTAERIAASVSKR